MKPVYFWSWLHIFGAAPGDFGVSPPFPSCSDCWPLMKISFPFSPTVSDQEKATTKISPWHEGVITLLCGLFQSPLPMNPAKASLFLCPQDCLALPPYLSLSTAFMTSVSWESVFNTSFTLDSPSQALLPDNPTSKSSRGQWFSNSCMHQNHQGVWLKHRLLGPSQNFWFSGSGMRPENLHF